MKFHNTLSKKIEEFKLLSDVVSIYSCGPTVYDYAHLGNLRAFVFVDTLRRTLETSGHYVKHVMNITDVGHLASDADEGEDKLEKGAARENKTVWEVAEHYTEAFKKDADELNLLPPSGYNGPKGVFAHATDFIDQQQEIIKILLQKQFAYITERAIYFDVSKLSTYGNLSGQRNKDKEVGAREEVVTDSNKRNPQDFALWFFLVGRFKDHSMHWASPWGDGFPGWHLECSAIIHATLGEPLDIHTGGVDHIGTHHTNEIAQTEAAFGIKLSNFWLHNEHMLFDGQKMSKSLGNFYTLQDIIKKGYDPLALRLLYLQSHYRSQANFTWDSLSAAQSRLKTLRAMASIKYQPWGSLKADLDEVWKNIISALEDDLNMPLALSELSSLEVLIEKSGVDETAVNVFTEFLGKVDRVLGLNLAKVEDLKEDQKNLLLEREAARLASDWNRSDEIRNQLLQQGVEIRDAPNGPLWSRHP